MSRRLGLIIGTNRYQDPTFRPLQFAENDARALAQWLVNARGGNWAPGNVQHVQGAHVTRELVESLITQMCLQIAEPGDLALVYFAGHAFVDERSGDGYLAFTNTAYQNPTTALHLPSLFQQVLMRSRASHILIVLDCFQTGQLWTMRRTSPYDFKPLLGPNLLTGLQQQQNRLLLCSCRGNEHVPEAGERSLGALMHQTIIGLCGPAIDPGTGTITLGNLQKYLVSMLGEQQQPQLFGRDQPPLVLVGDTTPPPAQAAAPVQSPAQSPIMAGVGVHQNGSGALPNTEGFRYAPAPAQREPSSKLLQAEIDQQRQQQYQQLINQAQQLLRVQKYAEAFTLTEQALQIKPNNSTALLLKGQILAAGGRLQDALVPIEQLLQIDGNNALAWSMRASLLSNMGQQQAALEAIEYSLTLEPNNPEAYGIKNSIMAQVAMLQSNAGHQPIHLELAPEKPRANAATFIIALILQIVGLGLGIGGAVLLALQARISAIPGLVLISLGLLLLCVNAGRGTHRYGFVHLIPTILISGLAGGLLGALYKIGYAKILDQIRLHPTFLVPVIFLAGWLIVAAVLPLLFAIGGLVSGAVAGARKR